MLRTFQSALVAVVFCSLKVYAIGTLRPASELAVTSSITNLSEFADYTFSFLPDTTVPAGGQLVVTFPQQFALNLGFGAGSPTCTGGTCTRTDRTVRLTLAAQCIAHGVCSYTIGGVQNPALSGGTGPFALTTYKGVNVLDMNLSFGVIGVAGAVTKMTTASVSFTPGDSVSVGDASRLDFFFRTEVGVQAGTWLRFTFPTTNPFQLGQIPTCTAVPVKGVALQGSLSCLLVSGKVVLQGIEASVAAGSDMSVRVSVTNPKASGTTGTFTIETGVASTNTVLERISAVSGVTVAPGKVTGISLRPDDSQMVVSTSRYMGYVLRFTLTNPIAAGGAVKVQFNSDFVPSTVSTLPSPGYGYIISGLSDATGTTASIAYSGGPSYVLTVSGFAAYTKQEIALWLYLKNPNYAGTTKPLAIYSTAADGTLIDQDTLTATAQVASTTSPTLTETSASLQANTITTLQIDITPNSQVPAQGYIKVRFPDSFTVPTPLPSCTIQPYKVTAATAQTCVYANGSITAQLFATNPLPPAAGPYVPGDFVVGQASRLMIDIATQLKAPKYAGTYFLDVSTYDTSMTLIESGTCAVVFTANQVSLTVAGVHKISYTPTILTWQFTPTLPIPSGASGQSPQGVIELNLAVASVTLYRYDLGIGAAVGGTVPCIGKAGIVPVASGALICTYTQVPAPATAGNLLIAVTNFQAIAANTAIDLRLSGLKSTRSLSTAHSVRVYQLSNRISTDIHTAAATLTFASNDLPTVSATSSITSTHTEVATVMSINFSLKTSALLSASIQFLLQVNPTHGEGYCQNTVASTLLCSLTPSASCSAECYAGSDMILLSTNAASIVALTTVTIAISNLMNPTSVQTSNDVLNVYTITNGSAKNRVSYNAAGQFLYQIAGTATTFSVVPSNMGAGYTNVDYTINLVTKNSVPSGGSIVFSFPATYTLSSSVPAVRWQASGASGTFACSFTATDVTFTGFSTILSGIKFTLTLSGVKNPTATGSAGTFSVTTKNSGGLVIDQGSDASVTFTTAFAAATTSPTVTFWPTNAGVNAVYEVQVTPVNPIGAGGTIAITFPSQFGVIPSTAECRAISPFTTFTSCALSGATFVMTLDTAYVASSTPITLQFLSIPNYSIGASSVFSLTTRYDSVTLDQSASSATSPTVETTAVPGVLAVSSIVAQPSNEGERAEYTVNFMPQVAFQSSDYIIVIFPSEYDQTLGTNIECWATGLAGTLICEVIQARMLRVRGHSSFTPCGSCTVSLTIQGIINPPATSATNYLSVGTLSGKRYLEFKANAGSLVILSAPGLLPLTYFAVDSAFARLESTMTFNVTVKTSIPSVANHGAIRIVYPTQYLLDDSVVSCDSSATWASGSPNCTVVDDYVKLVGDSSAFSGLLQLNISNVPNPRDAGSADSIVLKTLDEHAFKVLERTYANLHPAKADFVFSGPLIVVNDDLPIQVRIGTFSDPIDISVDYPCARNLTITPILPDFVFLPTTISLNLGQTSASFRIGAPVIVTTLSNIMLWKIENEASPAFYTPLQKTVVLVNNDTVIKVMVEDVPPIPIGGHSLPFKAWVTYAPVNDLVVQLSLSPALNGATLTNSTLQFQSGETSQYGQIVVSVSAVAGKGPMTLSLAGTDAGLYVLDRTDVEISLVSTSPQKPVISTVSVVDIQKSTAKAQVNTNAPGTVYFMYALYGTAIPPFDEVKHGGPPPYDRTRSKYGVIYIGASNSGAVALTDLQATRDYTFYAYFVNLLDVTADNCATASFKTKDLAAAAKTTLRFKQAFMNDFEVSQIKSVVALLLSLADWQVTTDSIHYASNSTSRRLADTGTMYTLLTLAIVDNPFNDNYDPPETLVARLAANADRLAARVNNFDGSYLIVKMPAVYDGCEFLYQPVLRNAQKEDQMIGFSAALKGTGVIYALAVLTPITAGSPLPWQISEGLNSENVPVSSQSQAVSPKEMWNSTFTNLLPDSNYVVYLACGNDHPTFAELQTAGRQVGLAKMTAKTPNPKVLAISAGHYWLFAAIPLLL